jgi:hypothetical protein
MDGGGGEGASVLTGAKLYSVTYFYNRHRTGTVIDIFKKFHNRKRFLSKTPSKQMKSVLFKHT